MWRWRLRGEIGARLQQHSLGLVVAGKCDQRSAEQALRGADAPVVFRKDAPAVRYQLRRQPTNAQAVAQECLGGFGLLSRQLNRREIDRVNRDQLVVAPKGGARDSKRGLERRRRLVVSFLTAQDP